MDFNDNSLINTDGSRILERYYTEPNYKHILNKEESKLLFHEICNATMEDLLKIIDRSELCSLNVSDTPMFSSVKAAIFESIDILSQKSLNYEQLGENLSSCISKNIGAMKKYGECHGKLLQSVGLAIIERKGRCIIEITELGRLFSNTPYEEREMIFSKMLISSDVIKNLMILSKYETVSIENELSSVLNGTTIGRRRSSTWVLLRTIYNNYPEEVGPRINNITD